MNSLNSPEDNASRPLLSLVIPAYNEAGVITGAMETVRDVLKKISDDYEIIIVDDGSTDRTSESIQSLTARDPRVRGIRFTRNFGKEAAILAGLRYSTGRGVVVMDGDLQHPPELMVEMVKLWREDGNSVVHAVKETRQNESPSRTFFANSFYKLMRALSGHDLRRATDYKLLDRRVVEHYIHLPEKMRFFRGLISWMGFKSARVFFSPPDRKSGESQWTSYSLVRLAVRAICSFSALPMQIVTVMGGLMFLSSVTLGALTLYMKFNGRAEEGFSTVILLLLFIGSILMMSLGIIGQYVAMLYEELKQRPSYIIDKNINL
ncbi:MAG: glycosyltransferase family 2 protein [Desulfobacterales bacterium]|nr:glycosyltransferase family 2 protein [Desulfobacterales bacterium]